MNHLPVPSEPLYPDLIVPCLCDVPYDRLDFETYPLRRGWDLRRLKAGFFDQHSAEDTASFLQDWLYFGVLYQALNTSKDYYVLQHLSNPSGRVTTHRLQEDVSSQLDRLSDGLQYGSGQPHIVHRAQSWLQSTEAAVKTLYFFCDLFDSSRRHGVLNSLPIPPEVDLSFRVLGTTLVAMCSSMTIRLGQATSSLRGFTFRGSVLAESRMKQAKWCPSEIERAAREFSSSSMHYISTLHRAETGRLHDSCTSTKCHAFFTDPATYVTQHASLNCKCSEISPDVATIVALIHADKIPLLTIVLDDLSTPKISIDAYKPGMEYVALSHVWADGLGNSTQNALPTCQLVRLKQILDELSDSQSRLSMINSLRVKAIVRRQRNISVRFWFDTICIPLEHVNGNARKDAIKTMRHVYKNAYQILVLDKELMNTDHVSVLETFMRCSLSGWMRRLWTLQEAVLGNRLFVKFQNQVVDVQHCYEFIEQNPQGAAPQSAGRMPLDRFYGSPLADCQQFYYRMRAMRDWLHGPEERKLTHLIKSKRIETSETKAWDDSRGTMAAFEASRYRTTSKKEDVFICLGNLLGYDENLFKIPTNQRVRTILEHKPTLPHGLLFVPGPRTRQPRWQWAVSDFDTEDQSLMTGDIDNVRPAKMSSNGLVVSYPGLILPQALRPDSPIELAIPVCVDSSGGSRAWWRFTLLPIDPVTIEALAALPKDSAQIQKHCILFHSKDQFMQAGIHMAAVLVGLDTSDISRMSNNANEVVCRFIRLVVAQYIGGDDDLNILQQRRDVHMHIQAEGFAWPIRRDWTLK